MSNKTIILSNIKFPNFTKDKEFKHLINFMLAKNIMQRCYKFNNIKNHPWFANFSWDNLINMSLEVPNKPKVKAEDLSKTIPFNKYVKVIINVNYQFYRIMRRYGKIPRNRRKLIRRLYKNTINGSKVFNWNYIFII